jgi:hypothetical protein
MDGRNVTRRRWMRVAAGAVTTTAVGVMSNVATSAAGSYWSRHGVLAWAVLGLLVAVLAVNECWVPQRGNRSSAVGRRRRRGRGAADRRDWWLAGLVLGGAGLAAMLWLGSRSIGVPDGVEPAAYGCGGSGDPSTVLEGTGALLVGSREVGDVEVRYSARCHAVWGQYSTEARVELLLPRVTITISRSTDGKTETAADLALTEDLNAPGNAMWTDVLRYQPSACYRAQATLTAAGRAPLTAVTGCASF